MGFNSAFKVLKISSDTIGNRTRDLPACSAVPQPPAPPLVAGASNAVSEFSHGVPDFILEPVESRGPSDGAGYTLDISIFMSWLGQEDPLFFTSSTLAVGPTQTPGV